MLEPPRKLTFAHATNLFLQFIFLCSTFSDHFTFWSTGCLDTECKFVSIEDTNGVLYYLGTKKGTTGYTNPSSNGAVTLQSTFGGTASYAV